ncbi:MAG TPA: adenylate cyclase regulatory domain-containing protein [Acidimicrobiales bacterium]|nr:adenylate cyclase regulatory domain-containing protein [Acidimicrobiales bacterium]
MSDELLPGAGGDDLAAEELAADVDEQLRAWGAADAEIARAREAGLVALLAVAQAVMPGEAQYTERDIAERVGIDPATASRYWRALGFADVDPDDRLFTDADADALLTVATMIQVGLTDVEVSVQMARVLGSSMAKVAEALLMASMSAERPDSLTELLALTAESNLETQARLLEYVWRRHMQAAARRLLVNTEGIRDRPVYDLAVGFADLVGFTALSQQVDDRELAHIVGRFESLAFDQVAMHGGRVAKMIGDEVMFVVERPDAALDIALDLAELYADDEVLSDVRVAVACGPVLLREGDYFGPVVNLASRIVGIALPGSVVVSESVHDTVAGDDRFKFRALRARNLKDIGRVKLWRVRRGEPAAAPLVTRAITG